MQFIKNSILFSTLLLIVACGKDDYSKTPEIPNLKERYNPGGGTTIGEAGYFSFDNPAPNLNAKNLEMHLQGDAEFEVSFVAAPSPISPGLGPQYNNFSCEGCHPKDGRAPFPSRINEFSGFFLRVSIPGKDMHGGPNPAPGFGAQLQNHAIVGVKPEVKFAVRYEGIPILFDDGTRVILKKPIYSLKDTYMPMPANAMFSPRIAPPVFGLGLLEAIPEKDILAKEDINDSDKDGISGKANRVWDEESKTMKLGRFGWKANTPTVMVQIASAYHDDMGVTSPLLPVEADYGQSNGSTSNTKAPDIPQETLNQVALYCRTLAVPAARNLEDPEVVIGYSLFEKANCSACHTPRHTTGSYPEIPAISNQIIYPYTDMLLHDMGDNLADGRPDFLADGNEWKTRPLWGIGLTKIANGHTNFLHDGRAKSIEEAILWHGGEAKESQKFYRSLSKQNRKALVRFVESL